MASVIQTLLKRLGEKQLAQQLFENLVNGSFEKTSERTTQYNCMAHAAYDCHLNWWPIAGGFEEKDRYWPKKAKSRRTMSAFRRAFELEGYDICTDGSFEQDFEKIALYVSDRPSPDDPLNAPTHIARQLPCGKWTSKLGGFIDIVHDTPERLSGRRYGKVELYMSRRRLQIIKDDTPDEEADSK